MGTPTGARKATMKARPICVYEVLASYAQRDMGHVNIHSKQPCRRANTDKHMVMTSNVGVIWDHRPPGACLR